MNGQLSYPTVIFLDEDFNMLQPLKGYQKADFFYKVMNFIGDEHYKETKWEEFNKSFVNPF